MAVFFIVIGSYLMGYGVSALYYQPKLDRAREIAMNGMKIKKEISPPSEKSGSATGAPKTTDQNQ